jgi:NitT/TauT family transport system substrate-binding protein
MALMAKLNIDRGKIEELPAAADLTQLFSKAVDVFPGFVTNQPFVAQEKGFPVNIIDPYDYGVRPGGNVYFTSEETLKNKRKELKAFLRGVLRGIIDSQNMPDSEVVAIVMKYNDKLNPKAELNIWKSTKEVLLEHNPEKVGYLSQEKWQYTAEISKDYGLIKTIPPIDQCYTNALIEEIHKEGLSNKGIKP